jgi:hypothetical protein
VTKWTCKCGLDIVFVKSALGFTPLPLVPDQKGDVTVFEDLAYVDDGTLWWQRIPGDRHKQHNCNPKEPD